MNHLSNLNVDPMKLAKSISDENNKTIKELFKDKILIENLERDFSLLHEQYKKLSTENFDLYYGIHHK